MSSKTEQQKIELKFLYNTISEIEEAFNEARINDDGNYVLPEYWALRIKELLEL